MDIKKLSREQEKLAHLFALNELKKEFYQLAPALQFGVKKEDLIATVFPWYQRQQEKTAEEIEKAMKELSKYDFYASPF